MTTSAPQRVRRRAGWNRPTLRSRLTVLSTATVAVAVIGVSLAAWLLLRIDMRDDLQNDLVQQSNPFINRLDPTKLASPPAWLRPDIDTLFGVVDTDGHSYKPKFQSESLPVSRIDIAVAEGNPSSAVQDIYVDHEHYLMLTTHSTRGDAVQLAGDLSDVDDTLTRFVVLLGCADMVAISITAAIGYGLTMAGLRPVYRVASAAAHVASTQDLDAGVPIARKETAEVASVAASMNHMLAALGHSRDAQRQLIENANHELATPLTSLRTNVDLLLRSERNPERRLDSEDRQRLLGDIQDQMDELDHLIDEIVELSRDPSTTEEVTEVDLAEVARSALARAKKRTPDTAFAITADSTLVLGQRTGLERAVLNLLDNAAKWNPPETDIEISVKHKGGWGEITIRDHGPGVPAVERDRIFERFYRTADARAMPGSGLGLAIVRHIAHAHGGRAWINQHPDGGAQAHLQIPLVNPNANNSV